MLHLVTSLTPLALIPATIAAIALLGHLALLTFVSCVAMYSSRPRSKTALLVLGYLTRRPPRPPAAS